MLNTMQVSALGPQRLAGSDLSCPPQYKTLVASRKLAKTDMQHCKVGQLSASFDMQKRYGLKERVPEDDVWLYKYIMILDGNTFSSRLMKTLTAGSLVFRSGKSMAAVPRARVICRMWLAVSTNLLQAYRQI